MRIRGITLVEILLLVAILAVLVAMFLPTVGSPPPLTDEDLQLDQWQPGPEHSAVPLESMRVRDAELAGDWADGFKHTHMAIKPLSDGRYSVAFLSHTRCGLGGSVKLERVALYDDGVILLDRPVREFAGATYQRLYSVRIDDTICLLPSSRVSDIPADPSEIPHRGIFARVQ